MEPVPAQGGGAGGGAGGGGGGTTPLPPVPVAFVNWENLGVHPLDVTPDGTTLLVCNTPDNRLELFDLSSGEPVALGAVAVGLDPVTVRAVSDAEAWVVNHISDSISVVDLVARRVVATLQTLDEPADVVFAGGKAYVSCSQANAVQVFDVADPAAAPVTIAVRGEEPKAMAVGPGGNEVFVAMFESGNRTTVIGGGIADDTTVAFPPNVVNDPEGPHGGVNPPPNDGAVFAPAQRPGNPTPPPVSLIVKQDSAGAWRDDTGADWTEFVSGDKASRSGRPRDWKLLDHDVAVIDTATNAVRYVSDCMNVCMSIAVASDGRVVVVGTEATNEIRFEPLLKGRFVRVHAATFDAASAPAAVDLNPHLDYADATVPQAQRDLSLGDPRGIALDEAAARVYVTGMGSNNLGVFDDAMNRVGLIEVGEGPSTLR